MKLADMKIGTRMYLGFGLSLSIMIVMIWMAVSQMAAIQEKLHRIVKVNNVRADLAGLMGTKAREISIAIRDMLLDKTLEKRQEEKTIIDAARQVYNETAKKVSDLTPKEDAKGHEILAKVTETQDKARGFRNKVMDLALARKDGEATDVLNNETKPVVRAWLEKVDELIRYQEERSQQRAAEAEATYIGARKLMFILGGIALLLSGLVAFFATRSITRPIAKGVDFAKKMAEGDLTQTLELDQKDEIGVLAKALNQMGSSLRQMFKNISTGIETLASSSTELSAVSGQTASGVKEMSNKASTVAAAAEEMSANTVSVAASMEEASTNLGSVASATEEMSATVTEIASNSEKARGISEQATAQAQAISTMMQQLGQAAQEIGKVTETITDISSQTNLLALNATIEAARAGAAGKGFAVVANEIKELARQTAAATEDIKAKIAGVQTSTGGAIADIEKITGVIKDVGSIVASIAAAIEEQATVTKDVAGNVAQASTGVKDANERVAQTASVSKSIAEDVSGVNSAVGEIRQGGEQVQTSAGELSRLAEQLKALMGQFRV